MGNPLAGKGLTASKNVPINNSAAVTKFLTFFSQRHEIYSQENNEKFRYLRTFNLVSHNCVWIRQEAKMARMRTMVKHIADVCSEMHLIRCMHACSILIKVTNCSAESKRKPPRCNLRVSVCVLGYLLGYD